jgi:thiamine biosynthesis protein ThiS
MTLTVNGKHHKHMGDKTIYALLAELGAIPEHTVLTVNNEQVCSKDWNKFNLNDKDIVEVFTFVGGG